MSTPDPNGSSLFTELSTPSPLLLPALGLGAPGPDEYGTHHVRYVALVPPGDILITLATQLEETLAILRAVPEVEAVRRQPPYHWSFKEVVGHMTDTERIFAYRALRFARQDPTPLPAFEQDDYVANAHFDSRPLADLLAEFVTVRQATLAFYRGLGRDAWLHRGTASGQSVTVRAIAYIIAGHERHHAQVLRNRVESLGA